LFDLDLKNDKPDNIAEAIIGSVDLRRAEEIAKATLLSNSANQDTTSSSICYRLADVRHEGIDAR
jgi:hypothetical protein